MTNLNSDNLKGDLKKIVAPVEQSAVHAENRLIGTLAHNWKWVALAGAVAVMALIAALFL